MSVPWCRWNGWLYLGYHQSSVNVVTPATGKWPKAAAMASSLVSPRSSSGCSAARRVAVPFGDERWTEFM